MEFYHFIVEQNLVWANRFHTI